MSGRWLIDGRVNLNAALDDAGWSTYLAVDTLVEAGIAEGEALDFARFACAVERDRQDELAAWLDPLMREQYERLTYEPRTR